MFQTIKSIFKKEETIPTAPIIKQYLLDKGLTETPDFKYNSRDPVFYTRLLLDVPLSEFDAFIQKVTGELDEFIPTFRLNTFYMTGNADLGLLRIYHHIPTVWEQM